VGRREKRGLVHARKEPFLGGRGRGGAKDVLFTSGGRIEKGGTCWSVDRGNKGVTPKI